MLPRMMLAFTLLVLTEQATYESSGKPNEKTEQVFSGPKGALGALQLSMSTWKPLFENSLTCIVIGMAPTLRILQIPALPVSVHSGELISSAAWAVLTRLNSDAATARLTVRIAMSFPHTELAESRAARGLRSLIVYWLM